jgi:hypothetical protein
LRTYHRNESSGRSDWFVLHRICLNDEQRRAVTSAIEPPRASSLGGGALETTRVLSRAAERHHREQLLSSRLMRSRKPLFVGPKSNFILQREKPDTDTSSFKVQSWVPDWPTSYLANSTAGAETAAQIAVERIPKTCVANIRGASVTRT